MDNYSDIHPESTTDLSLTPRNMSMSQYTRVDMFRDVCKQIPQNEFGLPIFIYRADLIPEDFFDFDEMEQASILGASSIELGYEEGFPTFTTGSAFWSQMPNEPNTAYYMFTEYLAMADTKGIRRIEELQDVSRQFSTATLREFYTNYFWSARCKAYDLFRVAAQQKLREKRILNATDRHFLKSEALLGKVESYFEEVDEDGNLKWLETVNAKVAMDMLDKLIKIQRTSLGMSAHGLAAGDANAAPANASVEVALRTIAQNAQDPNAIDDNSAGGQDLALLLNDPDTAMRAQELIVKFNSGGQ